jgi:hypothetical protein
LDLLELFLQSCLPSADPNLVDIVRYKYFPQYRNIGAAEPEQQLNNFGQVKRAVEKAGNLAARLRIIGRSLNTLKNLSQESRDELAVWKGQTLLQLAREMEAFDVLPFKERHGAECELYLQRAELKRQGLLNRLKNVRGSGEYRAGR